EARSRYERLTDGDTADTVAALLRRAGVKVGELRADFVSYSVVRTHLRDCLGAERDPEPPSNWEADRLDGLTEYATAEAAEAVRSLVNKGTLSAGGAVEPTVTISVRCSACDTAVPVEEALARGAFCDCVECDCGSE
ncbi:rod-determining factor RdfA, partial [Halolamina salina]|uniref:rod-determining factor RdfA n=1 Tax=Halolamina salina TaxID=1220023 RepID=UPI00361EA8A2